LHETSQVRHVLLLYLPSKHRSSPEIIRSSLSFDDAIKQVTGIYIRGDYLVGTGDSTALDNVSLTPIPEPASLILLGSGLIGLAVLSRKTYLWKR